MPSSKLIKNCIGAIVGTALGVNFNGCAREAPTHFRTDRVPSITIPAGKCAIYAGTELCYRGMDSARGVFYINNAENPIPVDVDTLRNQMLTNLDLVNLFILERVIPESLTVRNVGFNRF